jgi:hypothetical protein
MRFVHGFVHGRPLKAALAAPLARRQRRAQPWEARPAHAGPCQHGALNLKPADWIGLVPSCPTGT